LRRAYPDAFYAGESHDGDGDEFDFSSGIERMAPNSMPASPKFRPTGMATPGDLGTLTEEVHLVEILFVASTVNAFRVDEIA